MTLKKSPDVIFITSGLYLWEGFMGNTKMLVTLAMISALAYITMILLRVPIMPAAPFLTYDAKDVIIVIGGFLYGPLAALAVSIVVAFAEMVTVSETGIIGMAMNTLSSVSFACTASIIYKYRKRIDGAIIGLATGCLTATFSMLLWNYIVTPIFMGIPRVAVQAMLIPIFLPFNLIKTGINGTVVLLLYKPVIMALRRAGLYIDS
jgi:riboflavin transporter FmnP